ncbi:MAG: Non-heme chloroperoxidase [Microgenomates bacterium OLB23]|nr:MAG: Non-heme chloroperoxidase [Microgenomates bacterium OLB23]
MTKQSIVILHGWGSTPNRWQAVAAELENTFIPALPGFGGKDPIKPYSVDDYVAWLENYLNEKKLKHIVLVGHSNGGRIAVRYAARYKNVHRLVLISAAGLPNSHLSMKKRVYGYVAKVGKVALAPIKQTPIYGFAEKVLYKLARESDYYKASAIMKQTMKNMLAYDATEDVKKIVCPTLCVWGTHDTATPLWMGEKIVAMLQNGTLKTIGAGHNIHITHPKWVAKCIQEFFMNYIQFFLVVGLIKYVHQVLYAVYLLQLKEYRLDRLQEHVLRKHKSFITSFVITGIGAPFSAGMLPQPTSKAILITVISFVLGALVVFLFGVIGMVSMLLLSFGVVLIALALIQPVEFVLRQHTYKKAHHKITQLKKARAYCYRHHW